MCSSDLFLDGEHGVGQRGQFAKAELQFAFGQHGGDFFHAFQRLDAALRLPRLGGFGLEAVDELLQVRALFLLFGPGGLLQGQLLGAQFFKGAVAAAVAGELAVFDVQCGLRDGVQKVAVVADDDERAGVWRNM